MKMNSARLRPVMIVIAFCLTATAYCGAMPYTGANPLSDTGKITIRAKTVKDPYLRLNEIHWRAAKDFIKRFPAVTTDKWLRIGDGYMAKFTVNQYPVKVYYDKQGRFISVIQYYEQDKLATAIKTHVNNLYKDFSIIGITEVTTDEGTFYHVNIKNKSEFKVLLVKGNMIEVVKEMSSGS